MATARAMVNAELKTTRFVMVEVEDEDEGGSGSDARAFTLRVVGKGLREERSEVW